LLGFTHKLNQVPGGEKSGVVGFGLTVVDPQPVGDGITGNFVPSVEKYGTIERQHARNRPEKSRFTGAIDSLNPVYSGRDVQFRNLQCELTVVGFSEVLNGEHVGLLVRMRLQVTGFCGFGMEILMTGRGKVLEEVDCNQTDGIPFLYRSCGETVSFPDNPKDGAFL
jgi:hypothetical protein